MVVTVPEHGSGLGSPEHSSGLGSPRAQQWSGQSPSTSVVWAVPEHKTYSEKTKASCTIIWCIYLSPYSVKSKLTRLVKKANTYSTAFCPLTLSGKLSLGTCMEVCQCGPSHFIIEEAHTL